jgi:alpha-beta hydrolase superfamily lysophospholipase
VTRPAASPARSRPWAPLALAAAALLATACSTPPDVAVDMSAARVSYYVSENPDTTRGEEVFELGDGTRLGFIAHRGTGDRRVAIVYLHGIESHGGWFDEAGDLLCAAGYDVHCLDRRGSGINRENRGFPSGHVDSYQVLITDVDAFVRRIRRDYDAVYLVGLSWGGKLGLGYALAHPDAIDGLVLITPGLRPLVDVTLGEKLTIVVSTVTNPKHPIKTPIELEMFTTTPRFLDLMQRDPLRLRYATARFFWEGERLGKQIGRTLASGRLPVLLFLAGQDRIIDNAAVRDMLEEGLGTDAGGLEVITYDDQTHSIQFDAPRRLVDDIIAWIERHQPPAEPTGNGGS